MAKKATLHSIETRKPAPQALEFQIAKAAVRWELACRGLINGHSPVTRNEHAKAHKHLRRLASKLVQE